MIQPISYRDPSGFLVDHGEYYLRYIDSSYKENYRLLIDSGLYAALTNSGLIIEHIEKELDAKEAELYYKILKPRKVKFVSFPTEWCSREWKKVTLAYLKINLIALEYGMILKDATPYNFCIESGRPILLDTLSFKKFTDGDSWDSYKQFCQMLLAPTAIYSFTNFDIQKSILFSNEGVDLKLVSKLLPLKTWFHFSTLLHLHLHSFYTKRKFSARSTYNFFSKEKLVVLQKMLYRSIRKWKIAVKKSPWNNYYINDIESVEYLHKKEEYVTSVLRKKLSKRIIDLGANNGRFSTLASLLGSDVVSIESDELSISDLITEIDKHKYKNIATVFADITSPTPASGWMNEEHRSLLDRLGKADIVFGLALIHHLCIAKNLPLSFVAALFNQLSSRFALLEFIPKTDAKVVQLLSSREDVFNDYSEENFIQSFSFFFNLEEVIEISGTQRKLFLWEKK